MRALKGNLAAGQITATGIQISTCSYGQAIPLLYGYDRISPKLIWVSNFKSHGGGGGGFSGLFGTGSNPTTYTTNLDLLCGFNPMEGPADVWVNGQWQSIYSSTYVINMASVTAGQVVSFTVTPPNQLGIIAGIYLASIPYSESYNDFVFPGEFNAFSQSGNGILPLYNGMYPAPNNGFWTSLGQPYGTYNPPAGSASGSVTFPAAITTPFSIVIIYYYDQYPTNVHPLPYHAAQLNWEGSLGDGDSTQPIVYPEFAGVCGANIQLGPSPTPPQWSLHVKGMFGIGYPVSQGTVQQFGAWATVQQPSAGDCNVADVVFDLISSGNHVAAYGTGACWNHGCGFSGVVYDGGGGIDNQFQYSRYGSLAIDESGPIAFLQMRNYCLAYSILVSSSITDQTSCAQVLKDLAEIANCAPCFNGAALDFIPYCEVSNYGNGASFVAPTAAGPLFTFGIGDFKTSKKDKGGNSTPKPPVVHVAGSPEDNFNSLAVNFKDRTGTSNNNQVILTDAGDVTRQGPMTQGTRSWPWIANPPMAVAAGWAVLRRNIIVERDGTYTWSLSNPGWGSILSLMDLVLLNEPTISPDLVPVRITKIIEDEKDFTVEIEAEKFVYGASEPVAPGQGVSAVVGSGGGGSGSGGGSDPGSVNAPIIFEAIPAIANDPQLWLCVSGGAAIVNGISAATKANGGSGYQAANVTVTGTGTGCTMQAQITAGVVTGLIVTNPGENYTGSPTIAIVDPTGAGAGAIYYAVITASIPVSYAGCIVNISTDGGTTYNPAYVDGTTNSAIAGSQTMGAVFSANYPSHVDPDNSDTLNVDMTESQQALSAFTTSQQNSFLSLCYLQGGGTVVGANGQTLTIPYELIAYASESLSAANQYALGPPIRRGVYSTPVAAHNIGSQFSFLNDGIVFKMALPANLVGVTLYFKFQAVNSSGSITQSLASCTPYSFTPSGAVGFSQQSYVITPYPAVFQGKSGGWSGIDTNSSTWTNTADVYFPPVTATFSSGKVLNYAARDAGLSPPITAAGQVVWVTIFDPNQIGEPNGVASLTAYADLTQTRWNTPGYTRIGTLTSVSGGGGNGGGGGSGGSASLYSISAYQGDPTLAKQPIANQILLVHQVPGSTAITSVALPSGLTGSVGGCGVAPTGAVTISIKQNGTSIGTINFAASQTVATFTFTTAVTLSPGDILSFVFQGTTDATFSGVWWNLVGTRS